MLPLALDLTDRKVLALGGGPVSARRVVAFLDAGACVRLVAPEACEDLVDLGDRITWHARAFEPTDLDDVWLVHTATGDRATDVEVAELCRRRRIFCVNASESEAGSAAMMARTAVKTPTGTVTVAVGSQDPGRSVAVRNRLASLLRSEPVDLRARRRHSGWVALVGGGPGDDGLLTTRGRTLLHSADVVVVDKLAPHGVLDELAEAVQVIDVGKTPGHHPVPQREINHLLVEQAQLGKGVVRLKGGDPYVLGRGGEERLACEAASVSVEVVPGVTSAIAVPAAAGIPLTHRGVARGFTVVTGHDEIAHLPAGSDHTVVLLMGVTQLSATTAALREHGRDGRCPAAIIESGCTPQQRVTIATLDTLALVARERDVEAPAVVVIGDVVTLAHRLPNPH